MASFYAHKKLDPDLIRDQTLDLLKGGLVSYPKITKSPEFRHKISYISKHLK
jgi:hypothetical protein